MAESSLYKARLELLVQQVNEEVSAEIGRENAAEVARRVGISQGTAHKLLHAPDTVSGVHLREKICSTLRLDDRWFADPELTGAHYTNYVGQRRVREVAAPSPQATRGNAGLDSADETALMRFMVDGTMAPISPSELAALKGGASRHERRGSLLPGDFSALLGAYRAGTEALEADARSAQHQEDPPATAERSGTRRARPKPRAAGPVGER